MVTLSRIRYLIALAVACVGCLPVDEDLALVPAGGSSRLVTCDPAATVSACPPAADGSALACFNASAFGGGGFCAPVCGSGEASSSDETQCLASGTELTRCDPSEPRCPRGFSCYRTDVLVANEGVCTTIPVCDTSRDCPSERPICGGDILRALFPDVPLLRSDHLPCFRGPCSDACPNGCLSDAVTDTSYVPDICALPCGADQRCPPNFYCESRAGGGYPNICVPGFPGYRCSADEDCIVGSCLDTRAGFSVCSIACSSDSICKLLGGARRPLVCARPDSGAAGVCVSIAPFEGEACSSVVEDGHSRDCPRGKECKFFSALRGDLSAAVNPLQSRGECRAACSDEQPCEPVVGLPHVCLAAGQGGCYPAEFGVPCESLGEGAACIGGLTCHHVDGLEAHIPSKAGLICTMPCAPDAEAGDETGDPACRNNELTADGFCAADGFCRPAFSDLDPCERPGQCGLFMCKDGICHARVPGDPCATDPECYPNACSAETGTCVER